MKESHADRGHVWIQRHRPDLAEVELRKALLEDPDDVESRAALALCLVALERYEESLEESLRALALEADWSMAHYVRGAALLGLGRHKQAEAATRKAIDLDPEASAPFGLLAQILAAQHRWRESLEAAEEGLDLDPEDESCANLKALALIQLGESEAAGVALDAALQRDPENPITHRNIGWQALRRGDAKGAVTHYREALRLDPSDAAAREGLVEALKSRNIVYRTFLRIVLLLTKVQPRTAMAIFIGTVIARFLLRRVAESVPALAPVMWTLFWAVVVFVLATWIAPALFNLMLRLDREGKHALTDPQRTQTNWLAGTLVVAAACFVLWLLDVPAAGWAAIYAAALTIPISATFAPGRHAKRTLLGVLTLGLVVVGVASVAYEYTLHDRTVAAEAILERLPDEKLSDDEIMALVATWSPEDQERFEAVTEDLPELTASRDRANTLTLVFAWGFVIFTWIASSVGVFGSSD